MGATSRRVFVTGGAGFIGSHLVERLLESGDRVLAFDDLSFGKRDLLPSHERLEFVKGDVTHRDRLTGALLDFQPDTVIHLAAIHFIPYANDHPLDTVRVNIEGTRNLLDGCRKVKPEFVFFPSSAAVYPISDKACGEAIPPAPTDIYGITKMVGEDLMRLFALDTGIRTVVGRFFNVYGPDETNPHVIPEIVRQLNTGTRRLVVGSLEPKRDFVHVKDVVEAILRMIRIYPGAFDVFNVGSACEHSVADIIRMCEEILEVKLDIEQDTRRFRVNERLHLLANISKIESRLGWRPATEPLDGLRALLR